MPMLTFGSTLQRIMIIAALALLAAGGAAAHAAPSLMERQQDYTVTGRSAAEVRGQMDRFGPRSEDGTVYDANTRSELSWSYQYQPGLDGCRIGSANVWLAVVYVMPRWTDYESAPRDVRDSWDRYRERLIIHEHGHRDVGMQIAADLEQELLDMRARYCDELGKAADEAGRHKLQVLRMRNREFDDQTRHGADQGAVFP
jgi:predicted secreted Zn-dependent protease